MKIEVTRAFLVGGLVQEAGKVLDLPEHIAREVIGANKAVPAQPRQPVKGPMTSANQPGLVPPVLTPSPPPPALPADLSAPPSFAKPRKATAS